MLNVKIDKKFEQKSGQSEPKKFYKLIENIQRRVDEKLLRLWQNVRQAK